MSTIHTQPIRKNCLLNGKLYFLFSYTIYSGGKMIVKLLDFSNSETSNVEVTLKDTLIICGEYDKTKRKTTVTHGYERLTITILSPFISEKEILESFEYYDAQRDMHTNLRDFLETNFSGYIKID